MRPGSGRIESRTRQRPAGPGIILNSDRRRRVELLARVTPDHDNGVSVCPTIQHAVSIRPARKHPTGSDLMSTGRRGVRSGTAARPARLGRGQDTRRQAAGAQGYAGRRPGTRGCLAVSARSVNAIRLSTRTRGNGQSTGAIRRVGFFRHSCRRNSTFSVPSRLSISGIPLEAFPSIGPSVAASRRCAIQRAVAGRNTLKRSPFGSPWMRSVARCPHRSYAERGCALTPGSRSSPLCVSSTIRNSASIVAVSAAHGAAGADRTWRPVARRTRHRRACLPRVRPWSAGSGSHSSTASCCGPGRLDGCLADLPNASPSNRDDPLGARQCCRRS